MVKLSTKLLSVLLILITVLLFVALYLYEHLGTQETSVAGKIKLALQELHTTGLAVHAPTASSHTAKTEVTKTTKSEADKYAVRSAAGLHLTLEEGILADMLSCSHNMGVSSDVLHREHDKLQSIAHRAASFLSTLWEVVPRVFLPGVRNPCWNSNLTFGEDDTKMLTTHIFQYRNSLPRAAIPVLYRDIFSNPESGKRLLCLPYFMIAGFPKSGTTSLHSILAHHPQVAPPSMKEPHWWARVPLGDMERDKRNLKLVIARYLANFVSASKSISKHPASMVTYDGSQCTLIDSNFSIDDEDYCAMATVVHRVLPDLKILIVMRDPVDRLLSHFFYEHRLGPPWSPEMKANPQQYFHKYISLAVTDFNQCLTNSSLYECVNKKAYRKQLTSWLGVGVYHVQLLEWMQLWPRENFLFLKTEQLSADPVSAMKKMTSFLSLDSVSDENAMEWVGSRRNIGHYQHMLPETRHLLQQFYAPHNRALEQLVGVSWSYSNSTTQRY